MPFSELAGTGAFSNGELTRTAGTKPKLYRQRLFLLQTWGLGGDDQAIESYLNQMAGVVDKNRVVLTLGNFSTLNVCLRQRPTGSVHECRLYGAACL